VGLTAGVFCPLSDVGFTVSVCPLCDVGLTVGVSVCPLCDVGLTVGVFVHSVMWGSLLECLPTL
jgi:hypothetical protein